MGVSTRENGKKAVLPRQAGTDRPRYDLVEPAVQPTTWDWADMDMDIIAACTVAVLCAGDMVSFTMDRGHNSMCITLFTEQQRLKKWCNTPAEAGTYLLKVYDVAVARRNAAQPPRLLNVS